MAQWVDKAFDDAERLYHKGRFDQAYAACGAIVERARELPPSPRAIARSRAHEMIGVILREADQIEAAIQAFELGANELVPFPEHSVFRGRILISLGQAYGGTQLDRQAEEVFAEAARLVDGSEYEQYLQNLDLLDMVADEAADWRATLEEATERLSRVEHELAELPTGRRAKARAGNAEDALVRQTFLLKMQIARLQVENGSDEEAVEGFMYVAVRTEVFADSGDPGLADDALSALEIFTLVLNRPRLNIGWLLEDLAPTVRLLAQRLKTPEAWARACWIDALLLWMRHDVPRALGAALSTVALLTRIMVSTRSVAIRSAAKRELDYRREFALSLAIGLGDARLAAELIEGQRLQTLPIQGLRLTERLEDVVTDPTRLLSATQALLDEPVDVFVGGASELRHRVHPLAEARSWVSLEEAIVGVGGPAAWWWGTFIAARHIHWALRAPNGAMWCGSRELSVDDVTLLNVYDAEYVSMRRQDGASWRDRDTERRCAEGLSQFVLPEELRAILLSLPADTSLVVSGNLSAWMPLPSLMLDTASDLRLVERFVIRVQPPAFLVRRLAARAGGVAAPSDTVRQVLIACMDPTSDLRASYNEDIIGLIELVGDAHGPNDSARATRANLLGALRRFPPGAPGIFYYSGHAGSLDFAGGLNAVLALCDDEYVSAGDLLGVVGDVAAPSPSVVILSACDSSGASGTGGGEWMGLATGFLISGAHQVVATAWPVLDTTFGATFDAMVLRLAQRTDDVAYGLALAQRRALLQWRNQPAHLPISVAAVPVIWAAYQCIGVSPASASGRPI